ncbi:MAG TPA: hypothetical protein VF145_02620 [Chitinophagaceae bacterium]
MKQRLKIRLRDNTRLGILIGLFAPLLGIVGFYFLRAYPLNFFYYVELLGREQKYLTNAVTFSLLANAIFFTIFINSKKDQTAKGIFIVTVIYAIGAIILKLVY